MRLVAGLCPDPMREFTALPRPLSWIKVEGKEEGAGKREKGRRAEADLLGEAMGAIASQKSVEKR